MATEESYKAIFSDIIATIDRDRETLTAVVRDALIRAVVASRPAIIAEYERLRDETKKKFMQDANGPLDRHKCAACFMIAAMTKLDIAEAEQNPLTPKLTKERIAIGFGLSILISMIREDRKKNATLIVFLDKNNDKFVFPDTLCDEEPYFRNWTLCLYYGFADDSLHVLSLSNTLFLIEVFNRERATRKQTNSGLPPGLIPFKRPPKHGD